MPTVILMSPVFLPQPYIWAKRMLNAYWHRYLIQALRPHFDVEIWALAQVNINFLLNGVTFRFFHGVKYIPPSYLHMISTLKLYKGKAILLLIYARSPTEWLVAGLSPLPVFLLDIGFFIGEPSYYTSVEKILFRKVKKFYVCNTQTVAYLKAIGISHERIELMPVLGTDPNLFRPLDEERARLALGLPVRAKIVLYPGTFGKDARRKGLPQIIQAVEALRREGIAVELVCVGYEKENEIVDYKRDFVHFFKRVPQNMMPLFYNAADVTALFYDERFVNRGGGDLGTCLIESLFCGTPVVSNLLKFYPYPSEIPMLGRYVVKAEQLPEAFKAAFGMINRHWLAQFIRRHEIFTVDYKSKMFLRDFRPLIPTSDE